MVHELEIWVDQIKAPSPMNLQYNQPLKRYRYVLIMLVIFGVLLGMRLSWFSMFPTLEGHRPVNGVLDLRGVNLNQSPVMNLNGEWELYSSELLTHQDFLNKAKEPAASIVQVPGDWRTAASMDQDSSFGYATYRLRILTDPLQTPVTFWFKDIRSSSDVEINGENVGGMGQTADHEDNYVPRSTSFTAAYDGEGTTSIELLIRTSNYDSPYKGGISKPVQFGSQAAVDYVRWYSIGFQLAIFLVLMLHGMYACILYAFNPQERTLLVAAILTLSVGITVMAGHDNILMLWLPINYTWGVKLRLICLMLQNACILLLFQRLALVRIRKKWLQIYTGTALIYIAVILVVPISMVYMLNQYYLLNLFFLISGIWFLSIVGAMIFRTSPDRDTVFLLLTAGGIISNLLWSAADTFGDGTTVYYPLDIVFAITGFSAYWFKKYFRNARENMELNKELEKGDKIKDQFLANTSHELRTPLHGIINIAHNVITREKSKLDARSVEDMELLITIGRRMSHLLGDLLDVVRLKEHRITLQPSPLSVQSLVPGIMTMLGYMVERTSVQLQMDIEEDFPQVLADEKRLVQIMYNLLHNALKHTEEGTITVSAEMGDSCVLIHVADTGTGMDEAAQGRIFLPYEQGFYDERDGQGIGLGLSICKQLVELHGGTLSVRSVPGEGSVFSFNLPLAPSTMQTEPQSQSPLEPQHPAAWEQDAAMLEGALNGFLLQHAVTKNAESAAAEEMPPLLTEGKSYILAVDDDPVNLEVLVSSLSNEPCLITTARSGQEALKLLNTRQWDLLITDVMMPNMSGYELTRKVREQFSMSELPVLLLTARSQPPDIYTGFASGANDYITKPVDAVELKYRIRALTMLNQSIKERLRMEAAYLQAQIQPHFLFNTLNSLMVLSDIDAEHMRKLGEAFSSYLRISFNYLNTREVVDLSHELELVEAYLFIEKTRFEDRLSVVLDIDPDLKLRLPPLSIQPLVENAVRHGLLSRNAGGTICLTISKREGCTRVEVKDNGKGMGPDQVAALQQSSWNSKAGIGIANTNRRLLQRYGRGLTIVSQLGEGTMVSFEIPDRADDQEDRRSASSPNFNDF
ncbi:ATP-binding protein [Paenibacillus sp. AN1007]|uniref:histidine kinase n=1 Tax=Paenibacillus sp. AN1007 TaxID=3151385 RepID=A0AAU8N9Z2_9BACL